MADTKPAAKAASAEFVVASGVLVTRVKDKNVEVGVGMPFKPADDEERDALLASGKIVPASEMLARGASSGGASDAALKAVTARAEAAEAKVAELEKAGADKDVEIATLKAAAAPANPAAAGAAK